MPALKAQKPKRASKVKRIKESGAVHSVRANSKKAAPVRETQLEFHIRLPAEASAEEFTDRLIELVETFKGTLGGGMVSAGA
ncbi:MAG TPA: hypothetical protein VJ020_02260 [Anaerolineales bacterium]|nr:hypothetical protein [Anaerolineales bacterium]